ncbi:hypothetical protein RU639_013019 [Aspergillus parasiticus]
MAVTIRFETGEAQEAYEQNIITNLQNNGLTASYLPRQFPPVLLVPDADINEPVILDIKEYDGVTVEEVQMD